MCADKISASGGGGGGGGKGDGVKQPHWFFLQGGGKTGGELKRMVSSMDRNGDGRGKASDCNEQ